ncbi:MAG: membrane dipeptidase [Terriglobales bacterium]
MADYPHLTRALLERGYTHAQIAQLYGGNTLRLMHAVEATARRLQAGAR